MMVMPVAEPPAELHPTEVAYRHVLLQQSVTMLAYMDRSTQNTTKLASVPEPRIVLGFSVHDLPILIGAATGAVGLTIIILVAIIVWHCCRLSGNREKQYNGNETGTLHTPHSTVVHSDSVVFVGASAGQIYETQVLENGHSSVSKGLTRSQSLPFRENDRDVAAVKNKIRPASQPLNIHVSEKSTAHSHIMGNGLENAALPCILEGATRSQMCMQDVPTLSQCASCNTLEEPLNYSSVHTMDFLLKTRSLPTWSQGKLRPMSTEDDLNELYAKVNFSKKRKNRMGNDSAAAIALTKSRCNTLTLNHKDTDPLVDNEAVVVYDERTAV